MSRRSVWKNPYVDYNLVKACKAIERDYEHKAKNGGGNDKKKCIKTMARSTTIVPGFIGYTFLVYNGKQYIPVKISSEMLGHKIGEFSPTRKHSVHNFEKKKK